MNQFYEHGRLKVSRVRALQKWSDIILLLALGRSLTRSFSRALPELYFEKVFNLISDKGRDIPRIFTLSFFIGHPLFLTLNISKISKDILLIKNKLFNATLSHWNSHTK